MIKDEKKKQNKDFTCFESTKELASHEKIATDLLTSLKFDMSNLLKIYLRT